MTIQYSCISRGSTVLCSHQIGAGHFDDVARSILKNIPTRTDTKTSYASENYLIHTIVSNGIIYICAADKSFGHREPYGYLMEIQTRFADSALLSRAQFAMDGELNRDFSPVMSSQMEVYSKPGGPGNDSVSTLRNQVNEVKDIMTQNIEKVLERGERLEDLIEHTEELEAHSNTFRKSARKVHRKMWWKNTKMTICLVVTVLIVLLVIILIVLFSTHVLPVKSNPATTTTTTTARALTGS